MAHKSWTAEDFEGVIWSNECSMEKSKDPRQIRVFREQGEKCLAECVYPKEKTKGVSLIVWGCLRGKHKGSLVPITRTINKNRNIRLLRRHLIPVIHQMLASGIPDIFFQQDNAPVHKAYIVRDWLEDNNIDIIEYPPYFPDLNQFSMHE